MCVIPSHFTHSLNKYHFPGLFHDGPLLLLLISLTRVIIIRFRFVGGSYVKRNPYFNFVNAFISRVQNKTSLLGGEVCTTIGQLFLSLTVTESEFLCRGYLRRGVDFYGAPREVEGCGAVVRWLNGPICLFPTNYLVPD